MAADFPASAESAIGAPRLIRGVLRSHPPWKPTARHRINASTSHAHDYVELIRSAA
jgi:hypothetical protein